MKKKLLLSMICASVCASLFTASNTEVLAANDYQLAEVVVNGRRYVTGQYLEATNKVGILGQVDNMHNPISASTVTKKAVTDFISPTDGISGLLSLIPSVQYAGNPGVDQVNIRGFYESGYGYNINGIPAMGSMARHSMDWVDSIEVIEGPSTGVNGTTSYSTVGGTINIQSKVAGKKPITRAGLTWYSKKAFEESLDLSRRFGNNNRYGMRVDVSNVGGERGIDHWDFKQFDTHINLDQKTTNSKTNLLLGYTYTDSEGRPTYTRMGNATHVPSPTDGSNNLNPKWREDKYKQYTIILNHEQKLSEHATAFLNGGHYYKDWYYCLENASGPSLIDDNGNFKTRFEIYPIVARNDYWQIGLRGDFKTGALKNNYVIALDRIWTRTGGSGSEFGKTYYGNIYNCDTGSWASPYIPSKIRDIKAGITNKIQMNGWSVMDTISTPDDKLTVLLGVHGQNYKKHSYSRSTGKWSDNGGKSSGISPTFGINYAFSPRFSAYANHTENFVGGYYVAGSKYVNKDTVLDPIKVKQNEIGIKFKTGDFYHKLSYFDIKQPVAVDVDLGYTNTAGIKMYRRAYDGETRHKGIEYTATGALSPKWNMIGGFMYLDAKRNKTQGGTNDGKRPNGIPKWLFNAGFEYKANDNFSVLTRANYVGSSMIEDEKFKVPGYFRFDLGARYKAEWNGMPVTLQAMCYNVTDKKYWQPQGNNLYVGSPRTFMISATIDF